MNLKLKTQHIKFMCGIGLLFAFLLLPFYLSSQDWLWAKSAGGNSGDFSFSVTAFSDGSALITGHFRGRAVFGRGEINETSLSSSYGSEDIFIAKYNSEGNLTWAKRAGGDSSFDVGYDVITLADNSVLVTGRFGGPVVFGCVGKHR